MMESQDYRVYPYRWVVLLAFMFINLTIQMLWISFASITGPAARVSLFHLDNLPDTVRLH